MADRTPAPDTPELRARWGGFAWTPENKTTADWHIAKYPEGRQRSAVMPLLDLAQRQVGADTDTQGWLPLPVIEYVAQYLGMPVIRVLEVASFYFMYNLKPVGKFHVQVCGTTPCMLRGSDDIIAACKGNCATAPMVQINDDNYEDLTPERLDAVLDALAAGQQPKAGTQEPGRHTSEPSGGPTSLKEMVTENHDYRGEW